MEQTLRQNILACEKQYTDQIGDAAEALLAVHHLQIITVTGPTCSGKTTTAHLLTDALERAGR